MESKELKTLALGLSQEGATQIKNMTGGSTLIHLIGVETSLEEFESKAIQVQPQILVVEFQADDRRLTGLLDRLHQKIPASAVVALSSSRQPEDILAAMRLGVREYLYSDSPPQSLNEAALRLVNQVSGAVSSLGKLVSIMGVKGGVGASHLAVNLGWVLSQKEGRRVALADFNLNGGDLAYLMDTEPERDLVDVARNFSRLDGTLLDSFLVEAAPGLSLLAAPKDPVAAEEVAPEHTARALDHLVGSYAYVLADLSCRLDEIVLSTLERADLSLLVLEPTVPGLKATQRLLALIERLGHQMSKTEVVVSRADAKGGVPEKEMERILGRQVLAWLPQESGVFMEAANAGRPLVKDRPRARWSKTVAKMAAWMLNGQVARKGGDKK
jgi:pilus assembly protein CpaE